MKLQEEHNIYINEAFNKMKSKEDFLTLLNYSKTLVYGESVNPFELKNLNYHSNPKANKKRYIQFTVKKRKPGEVRIIHSPTKGLKAIQKCLNLIFQTIYTVSPAATGFVPGKSIVDNAKKHTDSLYVYNIDLKDFFPSIEAGRIWGRLQHPPFNLNEKSGRKELANIITWLCCHEMEVERLNENLEWKKVNRSVLPQGAPTSPTLTNIICQQLDFYLFAVAKRFGLKYSRYADDITFSSMHNVFQKDSDFLKELRRVIAEQHFHIKESKTRLQKEGYRQEVTGLLVNKKANVQKRYVKELRMWLYFWEQYGYAKVSAYFLPKYKVDKGHVKKGQPNLENVIAGKLEYLKMVKGEGNEMYLQLKGRLSNLINENNIISKVVIPLKNNDSSIENTHRTIEQTDEKFSDKLRINIDFLNSIKGQIKLKRKIIIEKGENLPIEEFIENNEKEEKIIDLLRHRPKDVTSFLICFRKSEGIKFLTHEFDKPNSVFKKDEILSIAKKEYEDIRKLYLIPQALSYRIFWFGFQEGSKSFRFLGNAHKLNWHSKELAEWINSNPGKHPAAEDSPFRSSMIIPFRKSYEIKSPELEELIVKKLSEKGMYTKFDLGIKNERLINLDKANFYTDVDALDRGLGYLFNSINQRIENSNQLKIEFSRVSDAEGRKRIIKIVHIDSVCNKPLDKNELFQGDLLEAEKALFGICDWSIISKSPDDSVNVLNILFDISSSKVPKEKIDDSLIEGFTNVLTFYS